jgi:hypothetical protein
MPAARPPANSVQNLEDPPNDNKLAVAVITTCMVLSTAFSVLRVYSRVFCAGKVKLEDCKCHLSLGQGNMLIVDRYGNFGVCMLRPDQVSR